MKQRKYLILGGVLFLILVGVIGFTYAYLGIFYVQENENIVNSDCFEIEFQEGNAIHLNRAYPMSDEDGKKLTPYTFTITNKCESWANYQINLESLEQTGVKVLPDRYLKVNLQEESSSKITTKLDKTLNAELDTSTTITGAKDAYKLFTGTLKSGGSKTYNLRIWMDSEVTSEDKDSMNASYAGKVSITFSYASNPFAESGTLMATTGADTEAFWGYKESITKLVIEPEMIDKQTELSWDVSESQDKSVMSYLVMNEKVSETEEDSYTLYLQSKGGIKANRNSEYLFYNFTKLKIIEGLEYFDTSNVTNMNNMFSGCGNLTSLNLSAFDTSKVTNMAHMFNGCSSLTSLDVSNFDTSNLTNMYTMFSGCTNLTSLNLSNFDTSKVTDMGGVFRNCSSLTSLDLSSFDTSNVTNMGAMFEGCRGLSNLDLSSFDTSNVTNMQFMFLYCGNLTNLDVSNFNTDNVTTMFFMFCGCNSLTSLDVSNFNTSKVTNMAHMFNGCSSLTSLDVSNFDTSNVTTMNNMFFNCRSLSSLDLSNFDTSSVTSMNAIFQHCSSLTSLDVSNFNTSKVTNMAHMFYNCIRLTSLDLSSFDISKVTEMENMFYDISSLTIVKVKDEVTQNWILNMESPNRPSSWNTSNVIVKNL